ncbi:sucrose-6-phosphate hydrolase [Litchfieldia alkalitelluris]|uniref:sucrose-6-phosphate hydrolase n=1 Tax=Litchfieldia alkalitelluris TaxID=304268 RepID=UPI0009977276|nr:sucrose-6-phosphate hydrolase [Litchfieldia alkalitelluris]
MVSDTTLRQDVMAEVAKYKETVNQDPYRLNYHIMPPVGLLNDPNGFIQWKDSYHLFYQWMPFKTDHGAKFWGHYTSKDLVHWKHEEVALTPSEWFEKNGCYSGSAIEHDGKMYVFYTGNVKDDTGKRDSYQCLAVSHDGIHFDKKGPVIEVPEGYTPHFRDPKVWEQDGQFFMVIGAQTNDLKGAVALFTSKNLTDWDHVGILTGGGNGQLGEFGYMFECPDMFELGGKSILIFSPQGLTPEGMKYHNVYQAGYVCGQFDPMTGDYQHGEFEELDRGFDFYAPQTTLDQEGRRILMAWMSVPEQNEQQHPTIQYKWLHNMTIPRELKLVDGKVQQFPVKEIETLREGEAIQHTLMIQNEEIQLENMKGNSIELILEDIMIKKGFFYMAIGDAAKLVFSADEGVFTLERKSYVDGEIERRQCKLRELKAIRIFIDTSSVEVFLNKGEECFSSRFYPTHNEITVGGSDVKLELYKWRLKKIC